ncbi:MAG: chemotaxis protein CheB [Bacteroidetes bacterium GWE2_29_8]|nr:MAG: chemotaxis protein CheB [Bacteroidetes bacterium GWE2_29_8]OFY20093.1 MAG: chemotaxis protein CheB [Bacteroidetes bacterium GWF2_29_10]
MQNIDFTKYRVVVIGGSAGSFPVITKILGMLNSDFPLPILLCLHRLKHIRNGFVEALNIKSNIHVIEPEDKTMIKSGFAYLAPSNYHLTIEIGNYISLTTEELINFSRPSIDLSFDSASYVYKDRLIGIILSGANKDGAKGMCRIKSRGGLSIIQDPVEASVKTMPESVLSICKPDMVLKTDGIIELLNKIKK